MQVFPDQMSNKNQSELHHWRNKNIPCAVKIEKCGQIVWGKHIRVHIVEFITT